MIDLFLRATLSNVGLSLLLALAAVLIGRALRRPAITHLMWLMVFLKLITPPVMSIAALPGSWTSNIPFVDVHADPPAAAPQSQGVESAGNPNLYLSTETSLQDQGKRRFLLIWLCGSALVFCWSLFQVYRFNRLLGRESVTGPDKIQAEASRLALRFGIRSVPTIYTATARLSPMVWWVGGKIRIIIPDILMKQMDSTGLQSILSHELAHVRRRDYMVRWLEWFVCVCFWWNPVMWWARRNLRANEELCCDALVMSSLNPEPFNYGESLLKAVEILACPAVRQPAVASGINGGDLLKRRVKMIVSTNQNRPTRRWLQACFLLGALIVLPLGLTRAQNNDADEPAEIKAEEARLQEIEAKVRKIQAELEARKLSAEPEKLKLEELEQRLAQTEKLRAQKDIASQQVQQAMEMGRISQQQAQRKLAQLDEQLVRKQKMLAIDAAAKQTRDAEQYKNLIRTRAELEALSEKYAPDHPEMIRLTQRLAQLKARAEELKKVRIYAAKAPTVGTNMNYRKADYETVLRTAIEEGMLPETYVQDKLSEIENAQYEELNRRLTGAVEAGRISKEDAAAQKEEYRKELDKLRAKRQQDWQQNK